MKIASLFLAAASASVPDAVNSLIEIQRRAFELLRTAESMPIVSDKNYARANKWIFKIFGQAHKIDTNFPCPCSTGSGVVADDFEYEYCEKVEKVATGLTSWLDIYECDCGSGKSPGEKLAKRTRRVAKILKRIAKCP